MSDELARRVWTAHADAWQEQGRLRERFGGGAAELPGVRLMASGLPHTAWNNGDVHDPALVDVEAVRAWYAERGVSWGLRVPALLAWRHGRHLFVKRCMGLLPHQFRPAPPPAGVEIRPGKQSDLDVVAAIDAAAYGGAAADHLDGIAPMLGGGAFTYALALLDGEPVGVAYAVATNDWAGPSVGIFGVAVVEHARRRGIGAAVSSWLVERAFGAGATLAHLNPDTEEAARLYRRLGFVESPGLGIYVDV